MTAVDDVIADIQATAADLNRRLLHLLHTSEVPDRTVRASLTCRHEEPVPYSVHDTPCEWAGPVEVVVFNDTREALWWCGEGHENSEPYSEYNA